MDPNNPPTNPSSGASPTPAGASSESGAPGSPYGQPPSWEQSYGQGGYGNPATGPQSMPQPPAAGESTGAPPLPSQPGLPPYGQPYGQYAPQPPQGTLGQYGQAAAQPGQPQYAQQYGQQYPPQYAQQYPPQPGQPAQPGAQHPYGAQPNPQGQPHAQQGYGPNQQQYAGQPGGQPGGQASPGQPPHATFDHALVTAAFDLPSHTIVRNFGMVRGIIVRSRSIFGQIGAGFQQLAGGNISIYTEMCERARQDAYEIMIQHAAALGANAIIGARYDATEITSGVTEVLCYGTAVTAVPTRSAQSQSAGQAGAAPKL